MSELERRPKKNYNLSERNFSYYPIKGVSVRYDIFITVFVTKVCFLLRRVDRGDIHINSSLISIRASQTAGFTYMKEAVRFRVHWLS